MFKVNKNAAGLLLLVAFFVLDRFLKFYFAGRGHGGGQMLWGLVQFRFALNSGISFGLPLPALIIFLFYFIAFVGLIGLMYLYFQNRIFSGWLLSGLIFIGAFSNFLDRLEYGGVIDYIDIKWFSILNLSDIFISVGVVTLAIVFGVNKDLVKR